MAVIRKRNRLVSFRLSEQEYEALQNCTVTEGARSISDFARGTLCEVLDGNGNHNGNGVGLQNRGAPVNQALEQLITTMGELSRVIDRLSILVEGNTKSIASQ